MLEVAFDSLWLTLNAAQMVGSGLHQLQLGPRGSQLGDSLLEIGVGHLVQVELRAARCRTASCRTCGSTSSRAVGRQHCTMIRWLDFHDDGLAVEWAIRATLDSIVATHDWPSRNAVTAGEALDDAKCRPHD